MLKILGIFILTYPIIIAHAAPDIDMQEQSSAQARCEQTRSQECTTKCSEAGQEDCEERCKHLAKNECLMAGE